MFRDLPVFKNIDHALLHREVGGANGCLDVERDK